MNLRNLPFLLDLLNQGLFSYNLLEHSIEVKNLGEEKPLDFSEVPLVPEKDLKEKEEEVKLPPAEKKIEREVDPRSREIMSFTNPEEYKNDSSHFYDDLRGFYSGEKRPPEDSLARSERINKEREKEEKLALLEHLEEESIYDSLAMWQKNLQLQDQRNEISKLELDKVSLTENSQVELKKRIHDLEMQKKQEGLEAYAEVQREIAGYLDSLDRERSLVATKDTIIETKRAEISRLEEQNQERIKKKDSYISNLEAIISEGKKYETTKIAKLEKDIEELIAEMKRRADYEALLEQSNKKVYTALEQEHQKNIKQLTEKKNQEKAEALEQLSLYYSAEAKKLASEMGKPLKEEADALFEAAKKKIAKRENTIIALEKELGKHHISVERTYKLDLERAKAVQKVLEGSSSGISKGKEPEDKGSSSGIKAEQKELEASSQAKAKVSPEKQSEAKTSAKNSEDIKGKGKGKVS